MKTRNNERIYYYVQGCCCRRPLFRGELDKRATVDERERETEQRKRESERERVTKRYRFRLTVCSGATATKKKHRTNQNQMPKICDRCPVKPRCMTAAQTNCHRGDCAYY